MNVARANQVLDLIHAAVNDMESQAERLALLLAECRRERYWEVRGYKFEYQWVADAFPETSLRYIRQLAKLGEAFQDEPEVITEIGAAKAALIKDLPHRSKWVHRAQHLTSIELSARIKKSFKRIKTVFQAQTRMKMLRSKIERLRKALEDTQAELNTIEAEWKDKLPADSADLVCGKTRARWKKAGLMEAR